MPEIRFRQRSDRVETSRGRAAGHCDRVVRRASGRRGSDRHYHGRALRSHRMDRRRRRRQPAPRVQGRYRRAAVHRRRACGGDGGRSPVPDPDCRRGSPLCRRRRPGVCVRILTITAISDRTESRAGGRRADRECHEPGARRHRLRYPSGGTGDGCAAAVPRRSLA
ncbi:MAG: hypothetical protein E6G84_16725 [Alphaproteobacteria bacterium]|nr:MAG: hypothetical protein E6G84_16725 [Alphaproteobacteria bacterium]